MNSSRDNQLAAELDLLEKQIQVLNALDASNYYSLLEEQDIHLLEEYKQVARRYLQLKERIASAESSSQ